MRKYASALSRTVLTVASVSAFLELLLYSSGQASAFGDLPRTLPGKEFSDLFIWSHNAHGCEISPWLMEGANQCSEGPNFNYPWYPIFILRILRISASENTLLGLLIGIASIAATLALCKWFANANGSNKNWIYICTSVFLMSKPFRYALERGQPDLLVYIAILLTIYLYSCRSHASATQRIGKFGYSKKRALGMLATAVATLIKLYPITSFLYLGLRALREGETYRPSLRPKVSSYSFGKIALFTLSSAALIALCIKPYVLTKSYNILNLGGHGFGWLVHVSESTNQGTIAKTLFVVFGMLCAFSSTESVSRNLGGLGSRSTQNAISAILIGSTIVCPLYLITESIYYKWIFLMPILGGACVIAGQTVDGRYRELGVLLVVLCVISLDLPYLPYSATLTHGLEVFTTYSVHPLLIGILLGVLAIDAARYTGLVIFKKQKHY